MRCARGLALFKNAEHGETTNSRLKLTRTHALKAHKPGSRCGEYVKPFTAEAVPVYCIKTLFRGCVSSRIRTCYLSVMSRLLYQLSYGYLVQKVRIELTTSCL